jgi:hypothetical protein
MRALLSVVILAFVTACTPRLLAAQDGERVLIRNGFVVPAGRLLRVDDMSVDCVIASEVLDEQASTSVFGRSSPVPHPGCPKRSPHTPSLISTIQTHRSPLSITGFMWTRNIRRISLSEIKTDMRHAG